MLPNNTSDKLIFVNINKSYEALMNNERESPFYRDTLYDCTVKYWRIADSKANSATHILGCYKGKVIEVVRINSFTVASDEEYYGRKIFHGVEQRDSHYMNMDIRELFDSLANFITKYWNI